MAGALLRIVQIALVRVKKKTCEKRLWLNARFFIKIKRCRLFELISPDTVFFLCGEGKLNCSSKGIWSAEGTYTCTCNLLKVFWTSNFADMNNRDFSKWILISWEEQTYNPSNYLSEDLPLRNLPEISATESQRKWCRGRSACDSRPVVGSTMCMAKGQKEWVN